MEASAIPVSVGLARNRIAFGASLLRIRTDEQLVNLFRQGNDEAFRVIHDRYRARMVAYARQMLRTSGQDPEDAVQEIFMRAYHGLRASDRELALRAWLYRIAHNRCIDDLRRPQLLAYDASSPPVGGVQDPLAKVEQRDVLRRLISDVQRLPDQQRSALLMRELSGMTYAEVAGALGVSVPAVKSLLVRARVGLAQASEARNTACAEIRADLILAHDRGVRSSGLARRHLRECSGCREFRTEVRGVSRHLAALAPTLGPIGVLANLLGWGGGSGAAATGAGAAAGGGAAAAGGSAVTAGGSAAAGAASAGLLASGAGHVVTLLAAAVVTAGGAVEIQNTLSTAAAHHSHRHHLVAPAGRASSSSSAAAADLDGGAAILSGAASVTNAPRVSQASAAGTGAVLGAAGATRQRNGTRDIPITEWLDPDMYSPQPPKTPTPSVPATTGASTAAGSPGSASTTGSVPASGNGTSAGSGTASPAGSSPDTAPGNSTASSGTAASGSDPAASGAGSASTATPSSSAPASSSSSSPSSSASTSASGSSAVGQSTSSASSGRVISFIQHRRARHHRVLDRLLTRY